MADALCTEVSAFQRLLLSRASGSHVVGRGQEMESSTWVPFVYKVGAGLSETWCQSH